MEAVNLYKIAFCGAYFGTITAFFLSWLIQEIKRQIRNRNFLKSMDEEIKDPLQIFNSETKSKWMHEELNKITNELIESSLIDLKMNIHLIFTIKQIINNRPKVLECVEIILYNMSILRDKIPYDELMFFYMDKLQTRVQLLKTSKTFQDDFFSELMLDFNELSQYIERKGTETNQ